MKITIKIKITPLIITISQHYRALCTKLQCSKENVNHLYCLSLCHTASWYASNDLGNVIWFICNHCCCKQLEISTPV